MDWDWLPPAAVVGALLVFIVGIWQRLDERSSLRKLERLAGIRSQLQAGGESLALVDEAIALTASRVVSKERPLDRSSSFVTHLMCGALMGLVLMIIGGTAEPWPQYVRAGFVIWGGLVGLVAACLALTIMVVELIQKREARKALLSLAGREVDDE